MTREEAIEIIGNEKRRYEMHLNGSEEVDDYYEVMNEFVKAYDMATKALEQRWIPVSERLPKIGEQVMVTLQHEFEEETVETTTYSKYGFYIQPVIAWMPLPEPYKAESEEI